VRQTLDNVGAPLATASYDPWGTPQGSAISPFGFTGELQDGAGLTYLRARWYTPGTGTFLAVDPFEGFPEQPYTQHPYNSSRWQTSGPGIPTKPYSLHPYQYAYSNPVLHTDPTGLCVPESDGPLACDPSLRSSLQNYLRDSRPFDNRARGDQGYQGINVVFDRYPDAAYTYELGRDTELRAFVTTQLPWVDADATLAQLDFNLQQWKLNYAQRNDLDPDLGAATVGMLGLGAVYGLECFFGPDGPGGGGGGGAVQGIKGQIREVQLPTSGRIRFVPPKGASSLRRGPNHGYIDRFGNEWVRGPSRTAGEPFEWDVQLSRQGQQQLGWLSRDGQHVNVSLKGHVTH
jgi:RHS repeat-associated protein